MGRNEDETIQRYQSMAELEGWEQKTPDPTRRKLKMIKKKEWTKPEIDALEKLQNANKSHAEISRRLRLLGYDRTPSSVSGRIARMGKRKEDSARRRWTRKELEKMRSTKGQLGTNTIVKYFQSWAASQDVTKEKQRICSCKSGTLSKARTRITIGVDMGFLIFT